MKRDRLRPEAPGTGRRRRWARAGAAAVGALRVGLGLALAVRPEVVPRGLGVDAVSARRMGWAIRMCAVRDAALGAGGLHAALTCRDVRPWLVAQAFSDAGDAAALGLAVRDRQASPARAAAFGGVALAAFLGGLVAARDAGSGSRARPL